MAKIVLALCFMGIVLGACSEPEPFVQPDGNVDVENVREAAGQLCGFIPTSSTVVGIVAAQQPRLSTVAEIAKAICDAITQPDGPGADIAPAVAGIRIHGEPIL